MKTIVIQKEDFNFKKNINDHHNKKLKRNLASYCLVAFLSVGFLHSIHSKINDTKNSFGTNQMTLQDLHKIKEDSSNFVSQLSFSDKNASRVLYELELNPIMNLNANKSLSEFFIKKYKHNSQINFSTIKNSPPLHSKSSFIEGKKYDTITVPVIQHTTELTTNTTINTSSLINFTYEAINGTYILKYID